MTLHQCKKISVTVRNPLSLCPLVLHDDVIKWKHFPRYWPFVRGIHRSPTNSPHKGQWRGALMFSLICVGLNWLNKQSWGWWFETLSCQLWRHSNDEPKMTGLAHSRIVYITVGMFTSCWVRRSLTSSKIFWWRLWRLVISNIWDMVVLNFRGTKSNWQSLDLTINSNDTRLQMETDVADSNWRMLIPTDIKVTDYARWNTDGLVR